MEQQGLADVVLDGAGQLGVARAHGIIVREICDTCEGTEGAKGVVRALRGVVDVGDASGAAVALQADGGPVHRDPILPFGRFGSIILGLSEDAVAVAVTVFALTM